LGEAQQAATAPKPFADMKVDRIRHDFCPVVGARPTGAG